MNHLLLKLMLFLMMSSILRIDIGVTTLSLYMPIALFIWIVSLKYIKFNKIYFFEIVFVLLYMYIVVSSLWSIDYALSLKLILGEIILLLSYFIIRYLSSTVTLEKFEDMFLHIAKFFTIASFILYIYGIVWYYVLESIPSESMYLNENSIGIFGLYLEGFMPRFRGLSESPNNYFYIEFLVMVFLLYKKQTKFAILAIITLILTVSSTGALVLISISLFTLFNKKYIMKLFASIIIVIFSGYIFYIDNEFMHHLLNDRFDRTMSGSGRFDLWSYVMGYLNESPLFGYGANTSRVVLENFRGLQSAHNSFLDIWLTTGVIGFLLLLSLFILLLLISFKLSLRYKTNMFIYLWILYFIISMANDTLHVVYTVLYMFFLYVYYNKLQKDFNEK